MTLLITYVLIAVGFSFLCSIAEAVILSVTTSFIITTEQEGKSYAGKLRRLKDEINSPLAVILTLNTIAHTVGAAGAGAQATAVFGSVYLGVFSAVLTLVILIFSEIIPKALGAHYWRALAPLTAYTLTFLIKLFYPFVLLSNRLTRGLTDEPTLQGFSREEFAAMAELGQQEGQLNAQESQVLQNLFQLREMRVKQAMTPRSVVFSLNNQVTVDDVLDNYSEKGFSRIPVYDDPEKILGFVLLNDLLIAHTQDKGNEVIGAFTRELHAILDETSLLTAFEQFIGTNSHIMLVVNEYGSMQGVLTLEDILESLLGLEIMDESDTIADMQKLARRYGALRQRKMGLKADAQELSATPSDKTPQ